MKSLIDLYAESFVANMPKLQLKKLSMLNYNEQYEVLDKAYTVFEKEIKKQFINSVIQLLEKRSKE